MADTAMVKYRSPQDEETHAIASKSAGRSQLQTDMAAPDQALSRWARTADVSRLVMDSPATRSDLRMVMESDDEIGQCIDTRLDKLLGVDWRLQGGSDSVREFVLSQVQRHYDTLVSNAFMARWYGYDVMERVYAIDKRGYWYVDKLHARPFEWFAVTRQQELYFNPLYSTDFPLSSNIRKLRPDGFEVDTHLKFLLTLHNPTYRNPRGKAQAVYLFWPWFYRKATWQFWMQFLERSGQPLLVGKSDNPVQMSAELAKAVQDAVIAVGKTDDIEAVSPNNKGEAFVLAEDRLVRRIQKVILGQTLTSDVGGNGTGSKALGEVHNEVRGDKTMSDLKLVRPTIQNYIDALVALNFPRSSKVELVYAVDRGLETARANRDAILLNTGTVELSEQYFLREYGFQPGDIKIVKNAPVSAKAPDKKDDGGNNTNKDTDAGGSTEEDED